MFPINVLQIMAAEDEEELEGIRVFNRERRVMREESDPFGLSNTHFKQLFRLNKEMAQYIFDRILLELPATNNPVAVPPQVKFFTALSFFASDSYQRGIGQSLISMSQQSVSRCIDEVSQAIVNTVAAEMIQFPLTAHEKNLIKEIFMQRTNFPGVIGAIDGTHIAIIAPIEEEHNYLNRKGYHSKNVQIICYYNLKILSVNAQFPGAAHDAYIWRNSAAKALLENAYIAGDCNNWLVGDSAYPQQPWLMTPIADALANTSEANYNENHIESRYCVERCIGVLKGRFQCILGERTLRYSPDKVGSIINTCVILHNICINAHIEENFDIVAEQQAGIAENGGDDDAGNVIRRNLVNNYFR